MWFDQGHQWVVEPISDTHLPDLSPQHTVWFQFPQSNHKLALVAFHLWKEFLWEIWMLKKFLLNFWVVATMKGWGHMGRSLLFSLLTTTMPFGSSQTLTLCCISTQLWDVFQERCLFSLTLPLPRFSFILFFMGLSVNNHHPHEIFQLLLELFGD